MGNYRLDGGAAAERLSFIGAPQAAGFELPQIKAILALEIGRTTCGADVLFVDARLERSAIRSGNLPGTLSAAQRAFRGMAQ